MNKIIGHVTNGLNNIIESSPKIIQENADTFQKSLQNIDISHTLQEDTFAKTPKTILKVFNSTIENKKGIHLISPEFNGCHGLAIITDKEVFMTHFPDIYNRRMKDSIIEAVEKLEKSQNTQVCCITPVDSLGNRPKLFDDYLGIIKEKMPNIDIKYFDYPNRSRGKTYQFEIMETDGNITTKLYPVARK